jgi:hypothetical protein
MIYCGGFRTAVRSPPLVLLDPVVAPPVDADPPLDDPLLLPPEVDDEPPLDEPELRGPT